jgi:hypothetical protein
MSVRAYDPALGRFLSRDPLGRAPLYFSDQPYVYAGNNPLINVDPSGQFMATEGISNAQAHAIMKARMGSSGGKPPKYSPPAVRLSGHTYTLADALKIRVKFQQDFFKAYAPGWPGPLGQAEADFTAYLVSSGRLARSSYWNSVDIGLVIDIWQAAYSRQHGGGTSNGNVRLWLRFIATPTVGNFWAAHNTSIYSHTFSGAGQAALGMETQREKQFINITLVMLMYVAIENIFGDLGRTPLLGICNPNTPCLKILADNYYPINYPVTTEWFSMWYGTTLYMLSCISPALSGVCSRQIV